MAVPTFRNEDDEAHYCLGVLREGTPDAKLAARERLAAIFVRRGLFAEAVEAYELNVRAGVRSPELFERLSVAYQGIGEHGAAEAALAEAQRVRTAAAPPANPAPTASPHQTPAPPVTTPPLTSPHQAPAASPTPPVSLPPTASPNVPAAPSPALLQNLVPPASAPPASAGLAAHVVSSPTLPSDGPPDFPDISDDREAEDADDEGPASTAALRADRDRDRWLGLGPVQSAPTATATASLAPYGPNSRLPAHWGVVDSGLLADVDDGQAARTGRAVSGPLAVIGAVIFLMLLPMVLLAMVVVNPLALYLEGRAAGPTLDAGAVTGTGSAALSPPIKIAAGATSSWYIQDGRSVSGLWASPGLELSLDQELGAAGRTFTVTAPRPQTWGETITIVERRGQGRSSQETLLPASLEAPASLPPAGTVLTGRIAGPVTAPRLSETSQFSTTTETLELPVQFLVVAGWEVWADRFVHASGLFFHEDRWLLVTIVSLLTWCVLAGITALIVRVVRR